MTEPTQLPNRLRELRLGSNPTVSQEQLAVEFVVTAKTIDRWEKEGIPAKYLPRLAVRFCVTIDHLLRAEQPTRSAA